MLLTVRQYGVKIHGGEFGIGKNSSFFRRCEPDAHNNHSVVFSHLNFPSLPLRRSPRRPPPPEVLA